MSDLDLLVACPTSPTPLALAVVREVHADGVVTVELDQMLVTCELLESAFLTPPRPGQRVLVGCTADMTKVVLGRVGAPNAGVAAPMLARDLPDALELVAKSTLTLRVGDGSITLRADGRILIQGKDLVSSAKRLNRIKGGAVSIN